MSAKEIFSRWGNRGLGALNFWAVVPQSLVAVITGYLGSGVHWISQLGAFGIFMSGLVGFVLASFGLAQAGRWRLYRVETKARERLIGESSPFDPMAPVYERKRLFLRDLVPVGRRFLAGRKFINCEIVGPGNLVVTLRSKDTMPWPPFIGNFFYDVDMIQIVAGKVSNNAIYFPDCSFEGCHFYNLNLLFYERTTEEWYWITPDFNQPRITDGTAGGDNG